MQIQIEDVEAVVEIFLAAFKMHATTGNVHFFGRFIEVYEKSHIPIMLIKGIYSDYLSKTYKLKFSKRNYLNHFETLKKDLVKRQQNEAFVNICNYEKMIRKWRLFPQFIHISYVVRIEENIIVVEYSSNSVFFDQIIERDLLYTQSKFK